MALSGPGLSDSSSRIASRLAIGCSYLRASRSACGSVTPPKRPDAGFAVGAEDGFAGQTREAYQRYVGTVKSLAREAGTFYAPVNEQMTASGGDSLISADHVHPNDIGHASIAEAFAGALRLHQSIEPLREYSA